MPENISEFRVADFEFRAKENRQDGDALGTVSGTVISYGDRATLPWGTEEFEAGAFSERNRQDLIVNRMHLREQPLVRGSDIRITDDKTSMRAEFDLPDNMYGQLVASELNRETPVLQGLSLEFRTIRDEVNQKTNHRIIREARMYGFGVVDRPAYPRSKVALRWQDYASDHGFELPEVRDGQAEITLESHPNVVTDDLGRQIFLCDLPLEMEENGERQVARLIVEGRLPYNVDGITSMARNEHVQFLPGAFTSSLSGEIVLLAGNNYDHTLAATAARNLVLSDSEEALRFRARDIPDTSFARDFEQSLRKNLIRGITAGWALQGSETETVDIEGGGKRIIVKQAMLCEMRLRSRSAFPGEVIRPRTRRMESRFTVV